MWIPPSTLNSEGWVTPFFLFRVVPWCKVPRRTCALESVLVWHKKTCI